MSWPLPNITPRKWQRMAFKILLAWLLSASTEPALIHAVMGAGKSVLIQAATVVWEGRVLIGAPTKGVADQLGERLGAPVFHSGAGAKARREAHEARVVVGVFDSLVLLEPKPDTLVIADEAHRADTPTFLALLNRHQPVKVLGFSATPMKGTKALGYWQKVLYSYRVIDALRDGVIVPWTVVPWVGEQCHADDAARHFASLDGPPGLINASSIEDAIAFAQTIEGGDVVHSEMPRREIQARLAKLETGETRWMVHVSLLAEGFDMPVLGRYIFRKPVRSRVSFAQQAGRVLRTHPGKERAIFYDPLDLFETLGLGVGALLSGGEEPELSVDYAALLREMGLVVPPAESKKRKPKKRKAKALSYLQVYFRRLAVVCREMRKQEAYKKGAWRMKPASERQLQWCFSNALRLRNIPSIPPNHLEALREVYRAREHWTKGDASDWIDIIESLKKSRWTAQHQKTVPDPKELVTDLRLLGVIP